MSTRCQCQVHRNQKVSKRTKTTRLPSSRCYLNRALSPLPAFAAEYSDVPKAILSHQTHHCPAHSPLLASCLAFLRPSIFAQRKPPLSMVASFLSHFPHACPTLPLVMQPACTPSSTRSFRFLSVTRRRKTSESTSSAYFSFALSLELTLPTNTDSFQRKRTRLSVSLQ